MEVQRRLSPTHRTNRGSCGNPNYRTATARQAAQERTPLQVGSQEHHSSHSGRPGPPLPHAVTPNLSYIDSREAKKPIDRSDQTKVLAVARLDKCAGNCHGLCRGQSIMESA